MSLEQSLNASSIALGEKIDSSDGVLRRVAELICRNPGAKSIEQDDVFRLLKDRESLSSTGLGRGIAIPHCTSDNVEGFILGVITLQHAVDFHSIDGTPTDIFFFVMGPRESRNSHIKLLSAISKFATQQELLDRLRSEGDPMAARDLLLRNMPYDEEAVNREKVLLQIFMQNMKYFEEVLNLLSSEVPGSISVLETRSAGAYLFRMPLFAAFWSDKAEHEGRIILAFADKWATNRLIRQIQEITGDPDQQSGVVVTVQNLSYAAGTLDF